MQPVPWFSTVFDHDMGFAGTYCLYDRLLSADEELTLSLPDQICNSPYCQPSNSYNASSETLVLDQLIIPKLIFFLILINHLVDIV